MKTLDQIAHEQTIPELWTDKRSGDGQGYTIIYEQYFSHMRTWPLEILEIGVNQGASIIMWLEWFIHPGTRVVGVDIEPRSRPPESERYQFVQGDQQDVAFWSSFLPGRSFDIIIDDGGHSSGQIEVSFRCLFPRLNPQGFYCIEDLGEAYTPDRQSVGFGNHLEFIKSLIDTINRGRGTLEYLHFYRELAILRKK